MTKRKFSYLKVYIDGASRGNPGPASAGMVFQDEDDNTVKSVSFRLGNTTNNVAEYFGLILALQEALAMPVSKLDVFTDSELLAKQFNGEYKIKEESFKLMWVLIYHLKKMFDRVTVTHIPREKNKLADKEANRALDGDLLL